MDFASRLPSFFSPLPSGDLPSSGAFLQETNRSPLGQDLVRQCPSITDRQEQPSKHQCLLFVCETCGTPYTTKRALTRHFYSDQHREKIGLPPVERYTCNLCGRNFSRDHDRQRHKNETHKGIKRATPSRNERPPTAVLSGSTPTQQFAWHPPMSATDSLPETRPTFEDDMYSTKK